MGVVRTVRATTDDLVATKGRLAIVGSVNSFVSVASTGVYAMSKHAVKALADALWYELHPKGVSVTHLAPGFVASEIRGIGRDGAPRRASTQPTLLDGAVHRSSSTHHGESHRRPAARNES